MVWWREEWEVTERDVEVKKGEKGRKEGRKEMEGIIASLSREWEEDRPK